MEKELGLPQNKPAGCLPCGVERIPLFQGIGLYLFAAKTGALPLCCPEQGDTLAISYCHAGQIVWRTGDGRQMHLNAGDFSLHTLDSCADFRFPVEGCRGMVLCIDLRALSENPPELLSGSGICGGTLAEKLRKNSGSAPFVGNVQSRSIFPAFFGEPGPQRLAYQRLKALELLLYLGGMEPGQAVAETPSGQVETIRLIHDQLTQNIGQRVTIESLARQYLINPTTLKAVFKSVYGTSIAAHIKEHRMELAARLLLETDLSIAEIGQQIGYESQSRFAAAFKAYYHALPKEYRKSRRTQP